MAEANKKTLKVTQIGKNCTCGMTENAIAASVHGKLVSNEPSVPERLLMLRAPECARMAH